MTLEEHTQGARLVLKAPSIFSGGEDANRIHVRGFFLHVFPSTHSHGFKCQKIKNNQVLTL